MKWNKSNKAFKIDKFQGFCVNDVTEWNNRGRNCDRTQTKFSNSRDSGLTYATAQQTKSNGTPTYTSSATSSSVGTLISENYLQNFKWGNTWDSKWTDGNTTTEKGYFYEGELITTFCYLELLLLLTLIL